MKENHFKLSVDSTSQCKRLSQPHYVNKKILLKTSPHSKSYLTLLLAALVLVYFSFQNYLVSTTYKFSLNFSDLPSDSQLLYNTKTSEISKFNQNEITHSGADSFSRDIFGAVFDLNLFKDSTPAYPNYPLTQAPKTFPFLHGNYTFSKGNESSSEHAQKYEIANEKACHIPVLNPFDQTVLKYMKKTKPLECGKSKTFPPLFKTDLRSMLIQVNKPEKYGYFNCCYSPFTRAKGTDLKVDVSKKCIPIVSQNTTIPEEIEFIEVSCQHLPPAQNKTKQIIDLFGFVRLRSKQPLATHEKSKNMPSDFDYEQNISHSTSRHRESEQAPFGSSKLKPRKKVNVVIFGLDGVSHMNFIRTMPLTFQYLTRNLSALGLKGYTKVGDNTFPNMIPALTGLTVDELKTKANCWKTKRDTFDDCPFIWKNYSQEGYATAYGEDANRISMFNFNKKGFKNKPTDSYFCTLMRQQEKITGHQTLAGCKVCYGPRFGFEVLLDYTQTLAVAMHAEEGPSSSHQAPIKISNKIKINERHYFQFTWTNSLTHDVATGGELGDRFLFETLQWFKTEGYLEDTVFILMSDHGIRWGDLRNTFQGKIEERMPFLYFVFPQWFRNEYSSAINNLILNENRLTSPFDLYETFVDILFPENMTNEKIEIRNRANNSNLKFPANFPRGISLFQEIPLQRTCPDAEISEHWCVCHGAKDITLANNSVVEKAAQKVVQFINGKFLKFPQCAPLEMKELFNAQVVVVNNTNGSKSTHTGIDISNVDLAAVITKLNDPRLKTMEITYAVAIKLQPGGGKFEATVTRHWNGTWTVSKEISRINTYGKQSKCVTEAGLKMFCLCKDTLKKVKDKKKKKKQITHTS